MRVSRGTKRRSGPAGSLFARAWWRYGGFPGSTSGSGAVGAGTRAPFFGGGAMPAGCAFARWRIAASMANASITSETCRCQPCQDRVSLWSSPSSFFAVSKLSSIAQRWPSTLTKALIVVPAGHQVEKNAISPSARLRRISNPRVQVPACVLSYSDAWH